MSEPVGSLYVAMRASLAELQGDMGKISREVNSFGARMSRSLQGVERSLNNSLGGFVNMRAIVAGAVSLAIGALARQFILFADEIGDTAARLNVSTTALQEWRYVATLSGSSAEDLTKAIETFQRRIGEVKLGGFTESVTRAQESLAKLGLSMTDLSGLSPEQQFLTVIDRLKGIENPAQRAAIAFELMGRSSGRLAQLIEGGSDSIQRLASEARKMGLILDEETIKKAGLTADEFDRIGLAGRVAGTRLAAEMLPAFRRLREIMTSPEFQNAMSVIARAFNAMFDTTDVKQAVQAEGGIVALRRRLIDLTQTAIDNRAEIDRLKDTWQYKLLGAGRVTAGQLATEARAAEAELDRIQSLISRFSKGEPTPTTPPRPEQEPFDLRNGERIKEALQNLKMRTAEARHEFDGLAAGLPSLVGGLGAMGQAALKAYLEGKPLPDWAENLNKEMLRLNGAQLHTELLLPIEKFRKEQERLNQLWTSGNVTLEDYHRKLFQMRETLAQTHPLAISLQGAADDMGRAFGSAAESAIVDFTNLRDVAVSLIQDIHRALVRALVTKPIENSITNLLGGSGGLLNNLFGGGLGGNPWPAATTIGSSRGNAFQHGRVIPHARGGILDKAVAWPMGGSSIGTAAESKAEAVMPLARGPDGKLGVMNSGDAGGTVIHYHFSPGMTPADMSMIRSQMEMTKREAVNESIHTIRQRHQTDSGFLSG